MECWAIFGEGQAKIFPVNFVQERKDCVVCYRIHFTDEVKEQVGSFDMGPYMWLHDLDGKALSIEEGKTRSYGAYINSRRKDTAPFNYRKDGLAFHFADSDDFGKENAHLYGSREYVNVQEGDLLIGMYFYSNREYFEQLVPPSTKYQFSYPFYVQMGIDEDKTQFLTCNMESIPA